MNDNSTENDTSKIEVEIVDPDEITPLEPKELEQEPSSLPAVTQDTSIARIDPLTAYLNEIRQYENLTEKEEHLFQLNFHTVEFH